MIPILLLLAALAALAIGYIVVRRRAEYPRRKVEQLVRERAYDEAASIALEFGHVEEAAGYLERAGKNARAAQLYVRVGQLQKAAGLFEKAGDLARAAHVLEQAGDPAGAAALRGRLPETSGVSPTASPIGTELEWDDPHAVSAPSLDLGDRTQRKTRPPPHRGDTPRPPVSTGRVQAITPVPERGLAPDRPSTGSRASAVPDRATPPDRPAVGARSSAIPPAPATTTAAPAHTPLPRDPRVRADRVEVEFRSALARAGSTDGELARVRDLAREAAEVLLAAGEIRRAADVFRDGGLDEEAVHLYVNVLGAAGDAAPLLAAAGHHERAAELYELAGLREEAAQEWATVARHAADPTRHLDRIGTLSGRVLVHFLEEAVKGPGGAELRGRLESARTEQAGPAPAAPPPPAEVAVDSVFEAELDASDLDSLARELAVSAAESAIATDLIGQIATPEPVAPPPPHAAEAPTPAPPDGIGLEQIGTATDRLGDAPVRTARAGPSTDALERVIGGRPCDLQNIEVYYRLGLACLAAGQWDEAMSRFEAVEEASPGYRDAWPRVLQIRGWRRAMGPRATLGPATSAAGEGRYHVRGEIARGPLAVVYRATDRLLKREVALKFFADDLGKIAEARDAMQREGRALSQVSHPNLVTVYDNGLLEGRLYLAMEFVDGPSVDRIAAVERLSTVEALRIVRQVLEALAYGHGRRILHGALDPTHILRSTAGLVKVVDFGASRALAASPRASRLLGASPYLAPEQRLGAPPDPRADVFAAGAVLYELLTGQRPFGGEHTTAPPQRPRALVPSIPEVLDATVMRALEIDPAERFQSASDFGKPIRRILEQVDRRVGERSTSQPGSAGASERPRPPRPRRRSSL